LDNAVKVWPVVALCVFLALLASIPGYFDTYIRQPAAYRYDSVTTFLVMASGVTSLLTALSSLALAVVLFIRKRSDRMAIFVSFFLLGYGLIMAGPLETIEEFYLGIPGLITGQVQVLFVIPTIILMASFPTGAVEPVKARPILLFLPLLIPSILFLKPAELQTLSTLRSQILLFLMGGLFLAALAGQIFRYLKKSNSVQRQQTKVVVFGLGLWGVLLLLSSIPYYSLNGSVSSGSLPSGQSFAVLWYFSLLILPASLTIAVVRSRLWEIDVIIRRTLVYSLITACLTGIYFGSVVIFQTLFSLLGSQQSPAVMVISTLIIAALFTPLRRKIQRLIDRRFFRQQYDAQQTLLAFSAALKKEIDLEGVSALLVDVVDKTIAPESVKLWIRAIKKA
jgi:hypothetical protein